MSNRKVKSAAITHEPGIRPLRVAKTSDKSELEATVAAIGKSQAIIEFQMDGTVITANENFLKVLGYTLDEIKGKHHSMFVDESFRQSAEYREFWAGLNRGEFQAAEYKRIGKGGKQVWIQASYNPILDAHGKPMKVVKFATDVTQQKLLNADYSGQIAAINKSQAVIEFLMDGTIVNANDIFLKVLGYALDEVKGRHHSIFVDEAFRNSPAYREFWAALNRGEFQAAEYKRIGKGGKEVWIQASYNPIFDLNGKPCKVVKFATDVTHQKLVNADFSGQIAAIAKSQAVIEFKMDGTILGANDLFLKTLGYTLDEVKGRHHSIFVDEAFRASPAYREFWAALNRGEYQAAEYKRIGKGGKEVWIQASYNPILDLNGKPFKVVKFATDMTTQKLENANFSGQIAAIAKSQAVIEFKMDGTIVTANDLFLKTLGYTLDEVKGRHHSIFVDEACAAPTQAPAPVAAANGAKRSSIIRKAVAIGVSTGGPTALAEVIPAIPHNFELPVFIVQHMPPIFTRLLAERLQTLTKLRIYEATDGMRIEAGAIYIAPGDFHMRTVKNGAEKRILLDHSEPENFCRPAVDVLFRSVAETYGGAVIAVILTGMGQDGRLGVERLRNEGAWIIAQDEASSVVWGMPGAVTRAGLADAVVDLKAVVPAILRQI